MKRRRFKTAFILGCRTGDAASASDRAMSKAAPGDRRTSHHHLCDGSSPESRRGSLHREHPSFARKSTRKNFLTGDGAVCPLLFRHEPILLDTAGGLKNIEDLLDEDEAILCYNGDVMTDLPLQRLLEVHEQKRPEVTLALRSSGPLLNVNINERVRSAIFGIPWETRELEATSLPASMLWRHRSSSFLKPAKSNPLFPP